MEFWFLLKVKPYFIDLVIIHMLKLLLNFIAMFFKQPFFIDNCVINIFLLITFLYILMLS